MYKASEGFHRLGIVIGGCRIEKRIEGHLGVDDKTFVSGQMHHEIRTRSTITIHAGEVQLLSEIAVVDHPRKLDNATQVQLAPAASNLWLAQRRGQ